MSGSKNTGGVRSFKPAAASDEIEVPIEDQVGPDGDDDEEEDDEQEEPRVTRAERKRGRYDGRLTAAEERARRAEEETQQLRGRLEQIERRVPQDQQTPQDNLKSAYDKKLSDIFAKEDALAVEFEELRAKNALTPSVVSSYAAKARALDEEKHMARNHYFNATQAQPQKSPAMLLLEAEYPDVMGDQRQLAYAKAEFDKRLALGEKDSGLEMRRAILNETRERFNPGRGKPDASRRDLYTSRGTGAGTRRAQTVKVTMGPTEKKLARAAFPHLPPEKADALWANTAGKRAALKKQQQT